MKVTLAALALGFVTVLAASGAQAEMITLRDITTPIVPTSNPTGDRDFGGNGPRLTVGVELSIERGGRAIFAHVSFSARELGGDGSFTQIGPVPVLVWRWEDETCLRLAETINTQTFSVLSYDGGPGCGFGCARIGAQEDGGGIVTVVPQAPGPVLEVTLLGDTSGDDISTDDNPHGDTSIRAIRFRPIDVTFAPSLTCG